MTDTPPLFGRSNLAERIAKAKDHMHGHRQHNETLWPHQPFAMTLGELLDAAERGLLVAAPSAPAPQPKRRDWCTDPDNCARCKAPQWDQLNHSHAGIPLSGITPAKEAPPEKDWRSGLQAGDVLGGGY